MSDSPSVIRPSHSGRRRPSQFSGKLGKLKGVGLSALWSYAMRFAAMGGKFAFILVAAIHMDPSELGRFGTVSSLALLVTQLVGLEVYQIVTREIVAKTDTVGEKARYASFAVLAAITACLVTVLFLTTERWPLSSILLAAGVVATEHLGNELFRILAAEKFSLVAIQSFSIRSGLWSLGLPILALIGLLPKTWSLDLVLSSWLISSLLGLLFMRRLGTGYLPSPKSFSQLPHWLGKLAPVCAVWLTITMTWRYLESGSRLIAGMTLPGHTAGHFTFLTSLAAISLTVMKGLIEPLMFARLAAVTGVEYRRRYYWISSGVSIACALASVVLLAGYVWKTHIPLTMLDYDTFAILTIMAVILNVSQAPHFVLYAHRRDRSVLVVSVIAAVLSIPSAFIGAKVLGQIGIAVGLTLGAAILLAGKWYAARGLDRHLARSGAEVV